MKNHQNAKLHLLSPRHFDVWRQIPIIDDESYALPPPSSSSFKNIKEKKTNSNRNNKTEVWDFFFLFFNRNYVYILPGSILSAFLAPTLYWVSSLYLWMHQNDLRLTKGWWESRGWWPRATWSLHKTAEKKSMSSTAAIAEQCSPAKPNKHIGSPGFCLVFW